MCCWIPRLGLISKPNIGRLCWRRESPSMCSSGNSHFPACWGLRRIEAIELADHHKRRDAADRDQHVDDRSAQGSHGYHPRPSARPRKRRRHPRRGAVDVHDPPGRQARPARDLGPRVLCDPADCRLRRSQGPHRRLPRTSLGDDQGACGRPPRGAPPGPAERSVPAPRRWRKPGIANDWRRTWTVVPGRTCAPRPVGACADRERGACTALFPYPIFEPTAAR